MEIKICFTHFLFYVQEKTILSKLYKYKFEWSPITIYHTSCSIIIYIEGSTTIRIVLTNRTDMNKFIINIKVH